jgi:ABC-2 type transport system permease protein
MISRLIRLQLKLEWRDMRSSTAAFVLSLIFGLGFIYSSLQASMWMIDLRDAAESTRTALTVAGFGLFTFAWPAGVVFVMGSNEMLDPGRFALYPVSAKKLLPGLLAAGFFGLGGLCTLILGGGLVAAWSQSLATAVAAALGVVLGLTLCVVASRALMSVLSELFRKRKARDITMMAMLLLIVGASTGVQLLPTMADGDIDIHRIVLWVENIAQVIAWTPFGWPWAIPAYVASGEWLVAAALAAGTLALIVGLALVWQHQIALGLIRPLDVGGAGEKVKSSALVDRIFPASPAGAVAKRSIRYWRRDPRRLMGIVSVLIMPLIMVVALFMAVRQNGAEADAVNTMRVLLTYSPLFLGYMSATMVVTDISYDGSALGQQIVAGVTGRDDRLGRAWALLLIVVPVQLAYLLAVCAYTGEWGHLPIALGLACVFVLGGVGIGSWASAMWQAPTRPAGQNPFSRGSASTSGSLVAALVGMIFPALITLPTLLCVAAFRSQLWMPWVALVVGALNGLVVLWWGIVKGGKRLDATWPEVLAKITWKG